jgi:hypothetical protein
MSQIKVDSITNTLNDGPVDFPQGLTGDASKLTLAPQIINFSPEQLATNVGVGTNITLTFDQPMQFSGVGTIRIRSGSASGTVIESFTCGVSTRATISGAQLIIDPTSDLNTSTRYYVTLPSVGIANTLGAFFKGTESYFFNTQDPQFSAQGGTYVYTLSNPVSPTGFYKYHIFTSSGILTTTTPSIGSDLQFMMVAGGGGSTPSPQCSGAGAGGVITRTGPSLGLSSGTYTITIGGGGSLSPSPGAPGTPSKISSSPTVDILTAFGGGGSAGQGINGVPGGSGSGGGRIAPPGTPPRPPVPGGLGTPGQGNPGGTANIILGGGQSISGGGGGAGGSGSSPYSASGGSGLPIPAFSSTILSGIIPSPVLPTPALNAIGPSGLYGGGGGGGGSPPPDSFGFGGPGGGGSSRPYASPADDRSGKSLTGGGAASPGPGGSALGGSGVVMLRYAVPSL